MALVLAETVAGSAAFLWLTPLWREVKRGYFTLTGVVLTVLAFAAWRAAAAGAITGDNAGTWSVRLTLASLIVTAVWTGAPTAQAEPCGAGVGFLSLPVAIAVLAAIAATGRQRYALALSSCSPERRSSAQCSTACCWATGT